MCNIDFVLYLLAGVKVIANNWNIRDLKLKCNMIIIIEIC